MHRVPARGQGASPDQGIRNTDGRATESGGYPKVRSTPESLVRIFGGQAIHGCFGQMDILVGPDTALARVFQDFFDHYYVISAHCHYTVALIF